MKNLSEYLSNTPVNEATRVMWVIELQPSNPSGHFPTEIMEICTSQKAAQVWCVEYSVTYQAWKLQYTSKGSRSIITGLWNEKTGDKLIIKQRDVYSKESTELQKID